MAGLDSSPTRVGVLESTDSFSFVFFIDKLSVYRFFLFNNEIIISRSVYLPDIIFLHISSIVLFLSMYI